MCDGLGGFYVTKLDPNSREGVLNELRRELAMRQRVYPRWVADGRLRQDDMDHRIACLKMAIAVVEAHMQPKQKELEL